MKHNYFSKSTEIIVDEKMPANSMLPSFLASYEKVLT